MKHCSICGIPKKTTFNCKRCSKTICLDCFNFIDWICKDCEIWVYNEKYRDKILRYVNA